MHQRAGWINVSCGLSEFQKILVNHFPKYASIAVQELMLPAARADLSIEERALLPPEPTTITVVPHCLFRGELAIAGEEPAPTIEDQNLLLGKPESTDCGREAIEQLKKALENKARLYPSFQRQRPLQMSRDWHLEFKVRGSRSRTLPIANAPQCVFRNEKLTATDSLGGDGTIIEQILVGGVFQRPPNDASLTTKKLMETYSLGGGVRYDTCQPGQSITLVVRFLEDCEFHALIFGKALL